jgi:hypothetical protein
MPKINATHLAGNTEIRLVLESALEHSSIILNKIEVNSRLSRRPIRVFNQSLSILM